MPAQPRATAYLNWLSSITPTQPRHFIGLDIAEEVTKTSQSQLPDSLLEWDPGKHPRRGGPPNAGWFASKGGGGGTGGTGGQRSIVGGILDRNREIANLTGGSSRAITRAKRLASELQSAARLPGALAAAFASGLKTGGKAVVNGGATAVKNVATLGLSPGQLELIGVTDEDRANGYDTAVTIATASGELLIAVGTGGIASALSKGGSVARGASGALLAYDAAGNAVGVVQGSYDAATNGVSVRNGGQIAAGALGLTANAKNLSAPNSSTQKTPIPPRRGGRYGHLDDPVTANSGKDFTAAQKKAILAENQRQNAGDLRDDRTGEALVPPKQRQLAVPVPPNEAQVDHVYPKSKGGPNTYSNAEVRSRHNNQRKGKRIE